VEGRGRVKGGRELEGKGGEGAKVGPTEWAAWICL